MKIFALYLRFDITVKPKWLDALREKYSSSSILHITLVQPRYIDENKIDEVKIRIIKVLEQINFHPEDKNLKFDMTEISKEEEGKYLFLWFIKSNNSIAKLQNTLIEELKDFDHYCDPVTKEYEVNFRPHMTVADCLENGAKVENLLAEDNHCEAIIVDLVMPVVKDRSRGESEDVRNFNI